MANEPKKKAAKKASAKSAARPAATNSSAAKTAAKKTTVKKATAKKAAAKKTAVRKPVPAESPARPTPASSTTSATRKEPAATKAAAPAATRKAAPLTTIVAKTDVGFGNHLYLRGSGGMLSWEKGVVMGNASSDEWVWSSDSVEGELEFKVLVNDEIWADGANATVAAGERIVIEPSF